MHHQLHRLYKDRPVRARHWSFLGFLLRLAVALLMVLGGAWLAVRGLLND